MKTLKKISIVIGVIIGSITIISSAIGALKMFVLSGVDDYKKDMQIESCRMSTKANSQAIIEHKEEVSYVFKQIQTDIRNTNENLIYFMGEMGVRPIKQTASSERDSYIGRISLIE